MQIGKQIFALGGAEKPLDAGASLPSHGEHSDSFAKVMHKPPRSQAWNDGKVPSDAEFHGEAGHELHAPGDRHELREQSVGVRASLMPEATQFTITDDLTDHAERSPVRIEDANTSQFDADAQFPADSEILVPSGPEMPIHTAPVEEDAEIIGLGQRPKFIGSSEWNDRPLQAGGSVATVDKGAIALDRGRLGLTATSGNTADQTVQTNTAQESARGSDPRSVLLRGEALPSNPSLSFWRPPEASGAIDLSKLEGGVADEKAYAFEAQALKTLQSNGAEATIKSAVSNLAEKTLPDKGGESPVPAMTSPTTSAVKTGAEASSQPLKSSVEALQANIANGMTLRETPAQVGGEPMELDLPGSVKPSGHADTAVAHWNMSRNESSQPAQVSVLPASDMVNVTGERGELFADINSELVIGEVRGAETLTARAEISGHLRTELPRHIAMQLADVARTMPDRPIELTLSPEELGRLRLTFSGDLSAMTVTVNVERPETLELMRRHIDTLAREMQEIGYEDVSFSFEHSGSEHGDGGSSSDSTKADNKFSGGRISDSAEMEQLAPVRLNIDSGSGLDIRL